MTSFINHFRGGFQPTLSSVTSLSEVSPELRFWAFILALIVFFWLGLKPPR